MRVARCTTITALDRGSRASSIENSNPTGGTVRVLKPLVPMAALLTLFACKSVGEYVWVDDLTLPPLRPAETDYVIAPGDVLSVRVWNQDAISGRVRVRPDGKIALPLVNEVEAAGLTPRALGLRLQVRFKEFVVNPVVTVLLEERKPTQVMVLGEVTRRGIFDLEPGAGVLQALAAAGGLGENAHTDRIFVTRSNPSGEGKPVRVRFDYDSLTRGIGRGTTFRLQSGDVVVVE